VHLDFAVGEDHAARVGHAHVAKLLVAGIDLLPIKIGLTPEVGQVPRLVDSGKTAWPTPAWSVRSVGVRSFEYCSTVPQLVASAVVAITARTALGWRIGWPPRSQVPSGPDHTPIPLARFPPN